MIIGSYENHVKKSVRGRRLLFNYDAMLDRIMEYNYNPLSFIRDLFHAGYKKDFSVYFDIIQFLPKCTLHIVNTNSIYNILNVMNYYMINYHYGYVLNRQISKTTVRTHRMPTMKHMQNLFSFFELYSGDVLRTNLFEPILCHRSIPIFCFCANVSEKDGFVNRCSFCNETNILQDELTNIKLKFLLTEDYIITKAPEIYFLHE